jgi:F-type H+-transporting ATPase subunit epsilon
MTKTIHVDVVSAQAQIFSGDATFVVLPGQEGELGIYPSHLPLMTSIAPGVMRLIMSDASEKIIVIAGGIVEVQPDCITVLADVAIRSDELDQQRAEEAKLAAENNIKQAATDEDRRLALLELAMVQAQFAALKRLMH